MDRATIHRRHRALTNCANLASPVVYGGVRDDPHDYDENIRDCGDVDGLHGHGQNKVNGNVLLIVKGRIGAHGSDPVHVSVPGRV